MQRQQKIIQSFKRDKKYVIQDLLCSLSHAEILKEQLYSDRQRLLDKETSRQQTEILLTPLHNRTILPAEAHIANWESSTSWFCMWIHVLHKYCPIFLFSGLTRHKMLNKTITFHSYSSK